jgi:glycerol dehydrogenase-like iron-containing ADH family enzyme
MKGGNLYAVFIGHQSNGIGGGFDLFNVVDPSPDKNILHGSTVGIKTIIRLGLKKVLDKKGNPVKLGEDTKGGY